MKRSFRTTILIDNYTRCGIIGTLSHPALSLERHLTAVFFASCHAIRISISCGPIGYCSFLGILQNNERVKTFIVRSPSHPKLALV